MKAKIFMSLLIMSLSVGLFAQPSDLIAKKQGMGNRVAHMKGMRGAGNGLNLTIEQKEAFKQGVITMHKQLQPLRNELGEAEAHQKTLNSSEKPDFGAINKNIDKIAGIRAEMAKIQTKNHLEMRAQLTDEQRLKFDMFKHGKGPKGEKGRKGGKGPKGQKGMM